MNTNDTTPGAAKPPLNAVVFGGTSAIAQSILHAAARERSVRALLLGRNEQRLQSVKNDLTARGLNASFQCADPADAAIAWEPLLRAAMPGKIDLFLVAHGELPEQEPLLNDPAAMARTLQVNFISAAVIATACARMLEQQGGGSLAVIGSVAADRGRASNFVYGSSKAGLETLLEGMRHRLARNPAIHVTTIKPGLTDTPMTAGIPKGPLFSSAEKVGAISWKAIKNGKPVAYAPAWWWVILTIVRLLPRKIFYRTKM
ncbi:MAG TPA: SDR family NAD(P)-dependent oxidoreductase [Verrucomicrobiae bacterium]|jgi:short-subunit dehydrogenase